MPLFILLAIWNFSFATKFRSSSHTFKKIRFHLQIVLQQKKYYFLSFTFFSIFLKIFQNLRINYF
ncbi:hypothetical protein LEP1GSC116_1268 [Leptospira interrogans serovar Icterohaemorrhagiae str. Verdun HP]|uniref:Uncharacterized protein n=5 Tax=Leptospira interrogans TaxID=173 RepID=M6ZFX1_LEPIR|nr:hypothetical protein LIC_10566 [Leptospira interrogans serovar Copenhageni str. Fiocruz L1-130]EMG23089.1 hypothetical protein LEP1GSC150_4310 [Leptospira interrogans serovar Copenhageni str. LT2050]EMN29741.1 hypothetical protein LEP1GSC083_2374 [Leptospira interrogans serovar Pyrogenes str. L0374]EMN64133.1 hypothetical protein LEP1GSC092_3190 [Leptospira interrogans serovar Pyrogenes str. R168]EMO04750.1 hypothetical protein LEP1GSC116_1268 [Leptospira interrogans serovar Icterohaemorrhag